jgi:hypothetical protein
LCEAPHCPVFGQEIDAKGDSVGDTDRLATENAIEVEEEEEEEEEDTTAPIATAFVLQVKLSHSKSRPPPL